MQTTTLTIAPDEIYKVTLGRQETYGVRSIVFDLSTFISTYGDGTATITHQRSDDISPYNVATSAFGDDTLTWAISRTDTLYGGVGKAEIRFATADGLEKSAIITTVTFPSITADTTIPSALQSWYDAMIEYLDTYMVKIEDVSASVTGLAEGSDPTVSVSYADNELTFAFGIPKGDRGCGVASIVFNADYTMTITDDDGNTWTSGSLRGEQGEQGVGISTIEHRYAVSSSKSSAPTSWYLVVPSMTTTNRYLWHYTMTYYTDGSKAQSPQGVIGVYGDTGIQGETGNGISSIALTSTAGLVDTYTITFTDGTTTTFTVTNGQDATIDATLDGTSSNAVQNSAIVDALVNKADAIINTATGTIASFSDGSANTLQSLTVGIEPVQNLNGQDAPYPAGGGKNKFDQDTVYASYKQSDGSFIGTATDINSIEVNMPSSLVGQTLTFSASVKIPSGSTINNIKVIANVNGTKVIGNSVATSTYTTSKVTFTPASTDDYIYISYGAGGTQLIQFTDVQLEVGSTATTFAPYENICPITGHTDADVVRTGKNLFDEATATIYQRYFRNTGSGYDWGISGDSTSFALACKPNTTYTISCDNNNIIIFRVGTIAVDPSGMGNTTPTISNYVLKTAKGNSTITTSADAKYIVIQVNQSVGNARNGKFQAEVGSTVTTYESYVTPSTLTLTWQTEAGTVYGGSVTVAEDGSAVLTVDWVSADMGDLTWTPVSSAGSSFATPSDIDAYVAQASIPNAMADQFKAVSTTTFNTLVGTSGYYMSVNSQNRLYIMSPDFVGMTISDLTTAVTGKQVVYKIATPLTYTLSSVSQLSSLYGNNNVWNTTGDTTATYIADTKLYIDNAIATAVANI